MKYCQKHKVSFAFDEECWLCLEEKSRMLFFLANKDKWNEVGWLK